MRLLHTSDWHLGRRLHGADLAGAHAAWVDHVVEVVRTESVDVVLVAGDVFDRAIPPTESVRLWDEAVARVRDAGAVVVVSSGNHDSPVRLGAHAGLLARLGVHVRCDVPGLLDPVVLPDADGPVAVYALPYLEPTTASGALAALSAPGVDAPPADAPPRRTQASVVGQAAALVAAHARHAGHARTVVMAHTWVAGVRPEDRCDSEREIGCDVPVAGTRVGTLDRVPADAFDGVTYTALGHLHGPQVLDDGLRYSGSPVAFSFSERHHRKGSWLVELDATGLRRVERVAAPVHRGLVQLRGTLEELLTDAAHATAGTQWVKAVLTDATRPADAMRRLQQRFPHAVALEWAPEGRLPELPYLQRLSAAGTDTDVAVGFVAHVRGTEASAAEHAVLDEAFREVRGEGAEAPAAARPVTAREVGGELRGLDDEGDDGSADLLDLLPDDVAPVAARRDGAA